MARIAKDFPLHLWDQVQERFESYVEVQPDGCHLWTGYVQHGYGVFSVSGSPYKAHRVRFAVARGSNPPNDQALDHLCRVRHCVRPDHLELVTWEENIHRGAGVLAESGGSRTHCAAGHPLVAGNLYRSTGRSTCLACRVERNRAHAREHAQLVSRAASVLGITQRQYVTNHGRGKAAALSVLEESK